MAELSGIKTGPLTAGERVTLTDPKGRRHSVVLKEGGQWHTTKGVVNFDDLIGGPDGQVVVSAAGMEFLAFRPTMREHTVSMKRGAQVIYPKDAGQILTETDIFPGARVLEAGGGSGALSIFILRAIGSEGVLYSYEQRGDFAQIARNNIEAFFGGQHPAFHQIVGSLNDAILDAPVDRAVLDMLAPWECVDTVGKVLEPGGILCCYVATATQMGLTADTLRCHGSFTEPEIVEISIRGWHAEGLAIRPGHTTSGHTGFLMFTRRLAPGVTVPRRRRRPAPGAYGRDYTGPRPPGLSDIE
jgi:tRNA (adenine57-N1/adenine58-N1)-methyltransferase